MKIGNINISEISFRLNENSIINEVLQNNEISIKDTDEEFEDIKSLYSYGFLSIDMEIQKKTALIFSKEIKPEVEKYTLMEDKVDLVYINDLLSNKDIEIIMENKNMLKINNIYEKLDSLLSKYDFVNIVNHLAEDFLSTILNNYFVNREKNFIILLIDNEHLTLTGVIPKVTGCYDCLSKKITSKFSIDRFESNNKETNILMFNIGISILLKSIEQIYLYGTSNIMGNVIYYSLNNFEYKFDFNRRTMLCDTCVNNNLLFEEQNIRSINILKSLQGE